MSGEKERVTDSKTAKVEAAEDAKLIKEGDPDKTSYQLFRDEIDSMQRSGVSEDLRKEYRVALKSALGEDEMNRVVIDFLNDKDSAEFKNKDGAFTTQKFGGLYVDEASDVDKLLMPAVMRRFDDFSAYDQRDSRSPYGGNSDGITARDLTKITAEQQEKDDNAKFAKANNEAGYTNLLKGEFTTHFDRVDVEGQAIFKGNDGKASKRGIDSYLREADAAEGPEKRRYPQEFVKTLRQLSDNWDSPEVQAMTVNGDGRYITLDSIARGCGYKNAETFRNQAEKAGSEQSDKVKSAFDSAKTEKVETSEMTLKYEGGKVERTFTFGADKKMIGYSEKRDGVTTNFKVDPKFGDATNSETGAAAGRIHLDPISGKVTINEIGRQEYTEKPDAPPEQKTASPTETVAQTDTKIADLAAASTQQAGQGYWQVAEKVLEATKGAEENAEDFRAQNIVLMRALQMQHKQHGGQLAQHKFIANQSDLAKLNENIDAYIEQNPTFAKYKESLHKRLALVEAAS
jgi:hypothetical protein